jgi:hypothetical protein
MDIVRFTATLVLAVSLAFLPISAALAMAHGADASMTMGASADDCACCEPRMSDTCPLVCCHLSVLAVTLLAMPRPAPLRLVADNARPSASLLGRPDPPPPRS